MEKSDNQLIVEFMGLKPTECGGTKAGNKLYGMSYQPWLSVTGEDPEKVIEDFSKSMEYSSKWELLMPVVETIFKTTDYQIIIGYNFCYIEQQETGDIVEDTDTSKVGVDLVYDTIIKFFKWYTTQKL